MVSKIYCVAANGVACDIVSVEVDICEGLPSCEMVGLLSFEVREARERVKSALRNSGIFFPPARITISLSPADIRKEGSGFDLAIAVGILVNLKIIDEEKVTDKIFVGELGLDGDIRKVNGVLNMIIKAKDEGFKTCIIPKGNVCEASVIEGINIVSFSDIRSLVVAFEDDSLKYEKHLDVLSILEEENYLDDEYDFANVSGQYSAKRAIEIAVSGMHNIMLIGNPGCGKSLMAKCIPSIMPKLGVDEAIEITGIHSAGGMLKKDAIISRRPFISPHHTTTLTALIGGGKRPMPGDISLAHGGILYLDEFPEFPRKHLESLRSPMEDGKIVISRVYGNYTYPARFMLVASMNPCPCGYYPDRNRCSCSESQIKRYLSKLSGPMLDRIDMCVTVDDVKLKDIDISNYKKEEDNNTKIRERIDNVRSIQSKRFENEEINFNSQMNNMQIKKYSNISLQAADYLGKVFEKKKLSARSYYKIIKVARTIADMDMSKEIKKEHILEAISFRIRGDYCE